VVVIHVAITAAEDYSTRREAYRRQHIERVVGLRAGGLVVGAGPSPDGRTADIVYRLARADDLKRAVEEDPYWTGGVWTGYTPRSFAQFVEPWDLPPLVLDGSRKVTVVEGTVRDPDMAQFALIELRGAGRLAFGGFFPDGETFALCRTSDGGQALAWFVDSGFWHDETLRTRPLLHVL